MPLHKHICEECGKDFSNYFEVQRFCSRNCYENNRTKNKKCKEIICPVCGDKFLQTYPKQQFCSNKCKVENTKDQIEVECDYCGKLFTRKRSEIIKSKNHYCSAQCKRNGLGWTEEDTQILRDNYYKIPNIELAKMLSEYKTVDAICRRAQYIGIAKSSDWSEKEIEILKENYSYKPMCELLKLLPNRTQSSILGQARKHNLFSFFYLNHRYSEDENIFLKENYLNMDDKELSDVLGRTELGIHQHLYYLGLHRPTEIEKYKKFSNYLRSRMKSWINNYKKEHNNQCELCGSKGNVVLHHIRGFNILLQETLENTRIPILENFKDYTQEQLDIVLDEFFTLHEYYHQYILIDERIHVDFHTRFGYGNNNEYQWQTYLDKFYKFNECNHIEDKK